MQNEPIHALNQLLLYSRHYAHFLADKVALLMDYIFMLYYSSSEMAVAFFSLTGLNLNFFNPHECALIAICQKPARKLNDSLLGIFFSFWTLNFNNLPFLGQCI